MITIKKYDGNWRLEIIKEEWEYKHLEELQESLNKILKLKEEFGNIK